MIQASEPNGWYALVDTAQDPALYPLVLQSDQQQCLISGEVTPVLAATFPYIVSLETDGPLAAAWRLRGGEGNWGLILQSALSIDALRLHFKKFLSVRLPDGRVVQFRFYDPRVFRSYLHTATPAEREPWFRGVARYWIEGAHPGQTHDYRFVEGQLFDGNLAVA